MNEAASESEEEGLLLLAMLLHSTPLGMLLRRLGGVPSKKPCSSQSPWEGFKGQWDEARSRWASTSCTVITLNKSTSFFHNQRTHAELAP